MKDSKPTLEWINERPEGTDELVVADILKVVQHPTSPEMLRYHTVELGTEENGPGVMVTSETGNPNFICEYFANIEDAFVTEQPNLDPAVATFLRGRGGEKAKRSDEDFTLGHNAIQNRIAENEQQDKGA